MVQATEGQVSVTFGFIAVHRFEKIISKGTFMQNRAIENKTEIRKWKCEMVKNVTDLHVTLLFELWPTFDFTLGCEISHTIVIF